MRKVKEKRPEVEGIVLMLTPPISREFQVFSGGRVAVGRGASAIGATVEDGWFTGPAPQGGVSGGAGAVVDSTSFDTPLISEGGLIRFGFVMGMADFVTVREAIALARARWCGERDDRIIFAKKHRKGGIFDKRGHKTKLTSHFKSCCCQCGVMICPAVLAGDPCERTCC
jgi:hypothetical protein